MSDRVWRGLEQGADANGPMGHGWSCSAHPVGAAAGLANQPLLDSQELVANAGAVWAHLTGVLHDALANHPNVGDVRGIGMLSTVAFVSDTATRTFFDLSAQIGPQVAGALMAEGEIGRAMPQGDNPGFAPPLCLNHADTPAA